MISLVQTSPCWLVSICPSRSILHPLPSLGDWPLPGHWPPVGTGQWNHLQETGVWERWRLRHLFIPFPHALAVALSQLESRDLGTHFHASHWFAVSAPLPVPSGLGENCFPSWWSLVASLSVCVSLRPAHLPVNSPLIAFVRCCLFSDDTVIHWLISPKFPGSGRYGQILRMVAGDLGGCKRQTLGRR